MRDLAAVETDVQASPEPAASVQLAHAATGDQRKRVPEPAGGEEGLPGRVPRITYGPGRVQRRHPRLAARRRSTSPSSPQPGRRRRGWRIVPLLDRSASSCRPTWRWKNRRPFRPALADLLILPTRRAACARWSERFAADTVSNPCRLCKDRRYPRTIRADRRRPRLHRLQPYRYRRRHRRRRGETIPLEPRVTGWRRTVQTSARAARTPPKAVKDPDPRPDLGLLDRLCGAARSRQAAAPKPAPEARPRLASIFPPQERHVGYNSTSASSTFNFGPEVPKVKLQADAAISAPTEG